MIDVMFLNILNIMAYINIKPFNAGSFYNGSYSMIGWFGINKDGTLILF